MNEPTKDVNWDWVTARHNAEPAEAFKRIRNAAINNIKVMKELAKTGPTVQIENDESEDRFVVASSGRLINRAASFTLRRDTISVKFSPHQTSPPDFEATPLFTANGENRFKIADLEIDEWQLLHRSLEHLLFAKGIG